MLWPETCCIELTQSYYWDDSLSGWSKITSTNLRWSLEKNGRFSIEQRDKECYWVYEFNSITLTGIIYIFTNVWMQALHQDVSLNVFQLIFVELSLLNKSSGWYSLLIINEKITCWVCVEVLTKTWNRLKQPEVTKSKKQARKKQEATSKKQPEMTYNKKWPEKNCNKQETT